MHRRKSIRIIASDAPLRRSLAFALEAEGYDVETYETWGKAPASSNPVLCTVVDMAIFRRDAQARKALMDYGVRMVVLGDGLFPLPPHADALIVTKPFEVPELLRAIASQSARDR